MSSSPSRVTYCKLYNTIVQSSVWMDTHQVLRVWITLLALKDGNGNVWGTVPYIANVARVTLDECAAAMDKFQQPDPLSTDPAHEGRRIEKVEGSEHPCWKILNHEKYREWTPQELKRMQWRRDKQRQRANKKSRKPRRLGPSGREIRYLNAVSDEEADRILSEDLPTPKGAGLDGEGVI